MKKHLTFIFLSILTLLNTYVAHSQNYTIVFEDASLKLLCPAKWKIERVLNEVNITSPDEEISIYINIIEANNENEADDILSYEITKKIQNAELIDEPEIRRINDLDFYVFEGNGKVHDRIAEFAGAFVPSVNKKMMIIVGGGTSTSLNKYQKELDMLIFSIQKI
ncbi:MAG: hypothetical protein OHK0038_24270 [Flammeovirgaceae bacterium]